MFSKFIKFFIACTALSISFSVMAMGEQAGKVPAQIELGQSQLVDQAVSNRSVNSSLHYGQVKALSPKLNETVFGQQIFTGGFGGVRGDGLNPDYKISNGDQVILRVWGAVTMDRVLPVDAQGNLFIPGIGPVSVSGLTQSTLDSSVRSAIKNIYPENVEVYTQLQGVQPISVLVTGFVNQPGRYAGSANETILYFLNQAKGIDAEAGSYRVINVLRAEEVVAQVDLYRFLINGFLPKIQFQEGDTIVVEKRGISVTQVLSSKASAVESRRYELLEEERTGRDLLRFANFKADESHVLVQGARDTKPFSEYLPVNAFADFVLNKGDVIHFKADERHQNILVRIEGSFLGQSHFIVPNDTTLREVLNNIPVSMELADINAISIRRVSIVEQQKVSLTESLRRLEATYLTASSSTPEEASIRVQEAKLIQGFVERAKQVEPNGRLVVASLGSIADVRLQDGDIITIPPLADSVLLSGQVLVPQSVVYQPGMSLKAYLAKAGGLTEQADAERIVVIRQSGEVIADADVSIKPGDEILVLPEVPTKNIQLATSISQILYQIAIAAKVAFDL